MKSLNKYINESANQKLLEELQTLFKEKTFCDGVEIEGTENGKTLINVKYFRKLKDDNFKLPPNVVVKHITVANENFDHDFFAKLYKLFVNDGVFTVPIIYLNWYGGYPKDQFKGMGITDEEIKENNVHTIIFPFTNDKPVEDKFRRSLYSITICGNDWVNRLGNAKVKIILDAQTNFTITIEEKNADVEMTDNFKVPIERLDIEANTIKFNNLKGYGTSNGVSEGVHQVFLKANKITGKTIDSFSTCNIDASIISISKINNIRSLSINQYPYKSPVKATIKKMLTIDNIIMDCDIKNIDSSYVKIKPNRRNIKKYDISNYG